MVSSVGMAVYDSVKPFFVQTGLLGDKCVLALRYMQRLLFCFMCVCFLASYDGAPRITDKLPRAMQHLEPCAIQHNFWLRDSRDQLPNRHHQDSTYESTDWPQWPRANVRDSCRMKGGVVCVRSA